MGNYKQLKQAVSDVIKTNGNQEITGEIMQNTLLSIISTVGSNATFAGIATPTTNPGTPDQNVFWIASKNGIYSNFGGVELIDQVVIFTNKNGDWVKQDTGIATSEKVKELEIKRTLIVDINELNGVSQETVYTLEQAIDIVYNHPEIQRLGMIISFTESYKKYKYTKKVLYQYNGVSLSQGAICYINHWVKIINSDDIGGICLSNSKFVSPIKQKFCHVPAFDKDEYGNIYIVYVASEEGYTEFATGKYLSLTKFNIIDCSAKETYNLTDLFGIPCETQNVNIVNYGKIN